MTFVEVGDDALIYNESAGWKVSRINTFIIVNKIGAQFIDGGARSRVGFTRLILI